LSYNCPSMREKYESVGLHYDYIVEKYPNLNEYEEIVNTYLSDPFFKDLDQMLEDEDYALAKDALKGLYILASDLGLFPLYETLLELYEDMEYETYEEAREHYNQMMEAYKKIRGIFNA